MRTLSNPLETHDYHCGTCGGRFTNWLCYFGHKCDKHREVKKTLKAQGR
jgi:hypothetical protein